MPFKEDLEHAQFRWQAEEENSRRLAIKARILATVGFGFLGVVLFRVLDSLSSGRTPTGEHLFVCVALGTLGLMLLIASIGWIFGLLPTPTTYQRWRKGHQFRRTVSPTELLILSQEDRKRWDAHVNRLLEDENYDGEYPLERDLFRQQRAQLVRDAATSLLERNTDESQRLSYAQTVLVAGLVAIILALMVWIYNVPVIIAP